MTWRSPCAARWVMKQSGHDIKIMAFLIGQDIRIKRTFLAPDIISRNQTLKTVRYSLVILVRCCAQVFTKFMLWRSLNGMARWKTEHLDADTPIQNWKTITICKINLWNAATQTIVIQFKDSTNSSTNSWLLLHYAPCHRHNMVTNADMPWPRHRLTKYYVHGPINSQT